MKRSHYFKFKEQMVKLLAICFSLILLLMNAHNVKGQTSQTFTATGSFTVPAGVTSITVECWGAGGGGGGASTTNPCAGGGGGGGSYARSIISVTPGNSYTVTVGTAGTAGAAGATGGTGGYSWFYSSSTILAAGGAGGVGVTTGSGSGGSGGLTSSSIGTDSSISSRTGFSTISASIISFSSSLFRARTLTICMRPGVRIWRCETLRFSLGCNIAIEKVRSLISSKS